MKQKFYLSTILLAAMMIFQLEIYAQPCPTSTAGVLSRGASSAVLNYNQFTPPPTYLTNPSGLPNTEFIITSFSAPNGSGQPTIIAVDDDGIFLPSDLGLVTGDSFCITPFSYDVSQFQTFVQEFLTGTAANIGIPPFLLPQSCCDVIELASGFVAGSTINLCDSLNSYGITSGSSVTSFTQIYNLILPVLGNFGITPGGTTITTQELDDYLTLANDTIAGLSLQALVNQFAGQVAPLQIQILHDSICGLEAFPLCYAIDPGAALCYGIDCFDTTNYGSSQTYGICAGGSITVNGISYNTPGTYFDTLETYQGCDSINIIQINNSTVISSGNNVTICAGDLVTVGANTYDTAGTFYDTFATVACDSVIETIITYKDTIYVNDTQTICEGESYLGETSTGIYDIVYTGFNGCDSTVHLDLTVLPLARDTTIASVCDGDSYSWGGNNYNAAVIAYDTFNGFNSCDSVAMLVLTINPLPATQTIAQTGDNLNTTSGFSSYQWYLGGSAISGAVSNSVVMTSSGYYQVMVTDSNGCSSMSDSSYQVLTSIGYLGVDQNLRVYPNPFSGKLTVDFIETANWTEATIKIFSITGELVRQLEKTGDRMTVDLTDEPSGIYMIQIAGKQETITARVVKY